MTINLPGVGREDPRIIEATIGPREIKFSLRTKDETVAAAWRRSAQADLELYFAAVEAGPRRLTKEDRVAVSFRVYRLYVETHAAEPGEPDRWASFKAMNRAASEGRILSALPLAVGSHGDEEEAFARFGDDLTQGINALPRSNSIAALEQRFGPLTNWTLAQEGIDVDAETRALLLAEIAKAATDAGKQLKRNARSDYRPDPMADRFPKLMKATTTIGFDQIWPLWLMEAGPSPSTIGNYRTVLAKIKPMLGAKYDDLALLAKSDMIVLKDTLLKTSLSKKTISDTYLAVIRAFLNIAFDRDYISSNPLDRVYVDKGKKAGSRMLHYTDDEIARLLALSENETLDYLRWLPLLAVTTGARIGELAQLWGSRVRVDDGVHVLHLAPAEDGGTLKTEGSERTVPMHPVLIESGFLDFVAEKGSGPLFYRRSVKKVDAAGRHASKGPTNRLAAWVRANGFEDPRKAPAHAIRHWWKSTAARSGIADSVADHLQGHATVGVAAGYRHHSDLRSLAEAVARMPVPSVETAEVSLSRVLGSGTRMP